MANDSSNSSKSPFACIRRVVTGHTPSGEAITLRDEVQPPKAWSPADESVFYDLYRSNETPALNDAEFSKEGWVDLIEGYPGIAGVVSRNGSVFRSFDLAPGAISVSHTLIQLLCPLIFLPSFHVFSLSIEPTPSIMGLSPKARLSCYLTTASVSFSTRVMSSFNGEPFTPGKMNLPSNGLGYILSFWVSTSLPWVTLLSSLVVVSQMRIRFL